MSFDFQSFDQDVSKAFAHVAQEISQIRSGRATVQLLDPVSVEAYGTRMKIQEVANVSAPDATLLMVSPWDKSLLGAIEKAIASAGLNLSPVVDGQVIRIVVPALTEERRHELVKVVHQRAEAGRVMLRTIRTETKKAIERQKGQSEVSEDSIEADLQNLESKVKEALANIDQLASDKEAELLKI